MSSSEAEAPTEVAGPNSRRSPLQSPFPSSLSSECRKAAQILDSFINPSYNGLEGRIPRKILGPAKGLVICSVFKLGFLGSGRFGSGLIVCRLPSGGWSAPSAVSLGGLGAGGQFGAELTHFVYVLNTEAAVTTFLESGTLTLGGNISIAFGTGRSGETGAIIGTKGVANIYAYSKTRGIFGGLTLEGGVLLERPSANKKIYGRKLKAKDLLSAELPAPPEAESLMRILNSDIFQTPDEGESAQDVVVEEHVIAEEDAPGTGPNAISEQAGAHDHTQDHVLNNASEFASNDAVSEPHIEAQEPAEQQLGPQNPSNHTNANKGVLLQDDEQAQEQKSAGGGAPMLESNYRAAETESQGQTSTKFNDADIGSNGTVSVEQEHNAGRADGQE